MKMTCDNCKRQATCPLVTLILKTFARDDFRVDEELVKDCFHRLSCKNYSVLSGKRIRI